jgi:hypothetical protein
MGMTTHKKSSPPTGRITPGLLGVLVSTATSGVPATDRASIM